MFLALLLVAASEAACPEPSTVQALQSRLAEAEAAYARVDLPGFEAAVEQSRAAVACLGEVAPPSTAAALHRLEGLSAFVASDAPRAEAAFGAARRIDPSYRFPPELVPEGNPALASYSAFDTAKITFQPIPSSGAGTLRVDGRPTRDRPVEVPALVQWVEPAGAVGTSAYLWPGDPLPAGTVATTKSGRRKTLAIVAASSLLATGALYGANVAVHEKYLNPATPVERTDGLRSLNNGLVVASSVGLAVTVGAGVGAVVASP
jgi:hypothetical protein